MQPLRNCIHVLAAVLSGFLFLTPPALAAAGETNAWAAGLKNLTPQQGLTLLVIARDLFPHDEIADSKYTACIDPVDTAAADPQEKAAVEDAMLMVAGATRRMGYQVYTEISDVDERMRMSKMLADGRWMRKFKKSVGECLDAQGK